MIDPTGARESNAGDDFHVLWATRRALALLDPGSDLEQVVVEELFPAEPNSDPNRLLGVDLTEYYGGNSMSNARRVVVTQLKYSERNPSRQWTAARLCDSSSRASVVQRLAEVFVDVAAGCNRSRVLDVLQIRLVSNRPVSPQLRAALSASRCWLESRPSAVRAADLLSGLGAGHRRELERLYTGSGLSSQRFTDFLRVLELDLGQQPRGEQELEIATALGKHVKADLEHHSRALYELVRRRALPEGRGRPIRIENLIASLGVHDLDALFPVPADFSVEPSTAIETRDPARIMEGLRDASIRTLIAHGDAGVGKTTSALCLKRELKPGSALIVFDCYASGDYDKPAHARHLPERALMHLCNELAAKCRLPFLIAAPKSSADLWKEFERRLHAAAETMADSGAELLVVVDAIDNAAWAAQHRGDPSFIRDLWKLKIPPSAGLIATARTSRLHLLEAPEDVPRLELQGFDAAASAAFLRQTFPQADDQQCHDFHERTQGNPRVQSYILETAEEDSDAGLKAVVDGAERTPDSIFKEIWRAVDELSARDRAPLERLADLMCLTPPVEIARLEEVGNSNGEAEQFCRLLVPGIRIESGVAAIRDEDFEKFLEDKLDPKQRQDAHARLAKLFGSRADEDPYAAEVVAVHLFNADQPEELLNLVVEGGEPECIQDPLLKLQIYLGRIRLALRRAQADDRLSAAKLLCLAARAASTDAAVTEIVRERPDLALRHGDPKAVSTIWRNDRNLSWAGPIHMRLSAIAAADSDPSQARAELRAAGSWLAQREETENHWEIEASDLAAALVAVTVLDGWDRAIERLQSWEPVGFAWEVGEALVKRLRDHFSEAKLVSWILATDGPVVLKARMLVALTPAPSAVSESSLEALALELLESSSASDLKLWSQPIPRSLLQRGKTGDGWPIEFVELVARSTRDKDFALTLLTALEPPLPRRAPSYAGDSGGFTLLLRARALKAACEDRILCLDELMPMSVTEVDDEADSKQKSTAESERQAMRAAISPLLPIYQRRAEAHLRRPMAHSIAPTLEAEIEQFADRRQWDLNRPGVTFLQWVRPLCETLILARGSAPKLLERIAGSARMPSGEKNLHVWEQVAAILRTDNRYRPFALRLLADAAQEAEQRVQPASELSGFLLDLSELADPYEVDLAAELYNRAVTAASGLDHEGIAALNTHARVAPSLSADEGAPTFARRIADVLSDYRNRVSDEDYLPWRQTLKAVTYLHPPSGIATLSRWEDERHLRIFHSAGPAISAAVETGYLHPSDGLALLGLLDEDAVLSPHATEFLERVAEQEGGSRLADEVAHLSQWIRKDNLPGARESSAEKLYAWSAERNLDGLEAVRALKPYFELVEAHDESPPRPERATRAKRFEPKAKPPQLQEESVEALEAWLSELTDLLIGEDGVSAALEAVSGDLPHGKRVLIFEALAGLPSDHSLFRFSGKAVLGFIGRQLERWSGNTKLRSWRDQHLRSLLVHQLPNLIRYPESSEDSLDQVALLLGDNDAAGAAIEAAEASIERLRASSLYALGTRVVLALPQDQRAEYLDWSLRYFEEDKTLPNPLATDLTKPAVLANLLWALFANPEKSVRWKAAHVARRLIVGDGGASVASELLTLWTSKTGGSFSSSENPFLWMPAQSWLLLTLARTAEECPGKIAPLVERLADIALDETWPHALNRELAKRAALPSLLSTSLAAISDTRSELLFANRPTSCRAKRESHHVFGRGSHRTSRRWNFGMDIEEYWHAALAGTFGLTGADVAEAAETWLIDRLGESPEIADRPEDVRFKWLDYSATDTHHGSLTRAETHWLALEYNSLQLVAGELIDKSTPVLVEDYDFAPDPWEDWLGRHLGQSPDFWISDLREATPPEASFLSPHLDGERWAPVVEHAFEVALGHPNAENLVVDGHLDFHSAAGWGYDSVQSALVSPATAKSLLRALEGAENMSFLSFPSPETGEGFRDDWIDFGSFKLAGWLRELRRERDGIEEFDPLARIATSTALPGDEFVSFHRASINTDDSIIDSTGKRIAWVRRFSDESQDRQERESRRFWTSGRQVFVDTEALLNFLQTIEMSLILKIGVIRRDKNSEGRNTEHDQEIHRALLIHQDGRVEGLGPNRSIGQRDSRAT